MNLYLDSLAPGSGHSVVRSTAPVPGGLSARALRLVREHIATHLHESITVNTLAALAGLSVPYFSRAFSRSTGLSPHRYLVQQRLERASHLLLETARPSSEIALLTGFSDQSHFIRRFVRFTGLTPQTYRKRAIEPHARHTESIFVQSRCTCGRE